MQTRLENTNKGIEIAEANAREAGVKYAQARKTREAAEEELTKDRREGRKRQEGNCEVLRMKDVLKNDERANRLAEHTRSKTQLEVLEQAEQSLAGYAEGARFLLDVARQSQLKGVRGALSASLDVPAELETAVAAALGDTLDAILLDANEIDEALQLLESDESRARGILPLGNNSRQPLVQPNDENCLGVASELVNVPDELRDPVHLILGQTLIVRDRDDCPAIDT